MVTENTPPRRPVLTLDDLARPLTRRPERLHALTASDLSIAFSQGLDLAEGKLVGHAQRVCYIATSLADALEIDPARRAGVYFGALLHDIGVTLAASDLCRYAGVDEEVIFGPSPVRQILEQRGDFGFADRSAVLDAVHQHCLLGDETIRALDLPDEAAVAVRSHHERWDGQGFPDGLAGDAIPIEGRIVAIADYAEVLIAEQPSSLAARRNFIAALGDSRGLQHDPALISALLKLAGSDEFWLGLYAENLTETLDALRGTSEPRKSRKRVTRFAEVFADLSDAKRGRTVGQSRRTAEGAEQLANALSLDAGHVEMVRIAALLQDIGQLGVPARIMSKPDILSVTEMQLMRQHPTSSEMILEELHGFEEIALWIARHHERPDGKGYPEMLSGDDIPLESRILAVADVFAALTSERPHRGAVSRRDARQILLGAAGTQLDAELVRLFLTLI
ncbi:MAG TPA: HD domain-containing phosphohydrolase [Dehalococcoidia bacterium]|nr:HD domain-containing phosphohydrolase [Dehalococcoidia bacterium]